MKLALVGLGLCLVLPLARGSRAAEEAATPAAAGSPLLVVRPFRAELQLQRLIALFEGSPAPHPAAALARWRQATGKHEGLSKVSQALIALLNPDMAPELRCLEHASFALDPTADHPMRWWAQLPDDDGTFAAVGTALALTDGRSEPPLGPCPVDRLGPEGSPFMATRPGGGVALAIDRATLEQALEPWPARLEGPLSDPPESGWTSHVDLQALTRMGPVQKADARPGLADTLLRTGLALRDSGCLALDLVAGIEGDRLQWSLTSHFPEPPPGAAPASLDPAWLDWIPARQPTAALVMAVPSGAVAWDRLFALADRIEKVDPARVGAADLRSRLNLLGLTAGVWPEGDLYPAIEGFTFSVVVDPAGRPMAGSIVLHARTPEAARRLADRAIKPLLRRFAGLAAAPGEDGLAPEGPPLLLGLVKDKPCEVALRGASLLVAWGPGYAQLCLDAYREPDARSAAVLLRSACTADQTRLQRLGIAWPARLPASDDRALAAAQQALPPIVWTGTSGPLGSRDVLTCTPLKPAIQAFLDHIPLAETASGAAP